MSMGCQKDRNIERQTDRQTERLFTLVIKTKVVKNVNRMSENSPGSCQWDVRKIET